MPAALEPTHRRECPRALTGGRVTNGPTTPAADAILHEKGVFVIPTSSATPAASPLLLQWVQNIRLLWDLETVHQHLDGDDRGVLKVARMRDEKRVHTRVAAWWRWGVWPVR